MPTLAELEMKLADVRREVRNLTVMSMRPDLTADQLEHVRLLERAARAEVKLRTKALDYFKGHRMTPDDHRKQAALAREAGRLEWLARQHEVLAAMLERRMQQKSGP